MEEMGALGIVQLQGTGDGFEHCRGDAGEVAPFEFRVVLDAHVGEGRDLAPAQARDAPPGSGGQAGPLRRDLRSPRDEELADLVTIVHTATVRPARHGRGVLTVHPS
jgi:hypothetical protein